MRNLREEKYSIASLLFLAPAAPLFATRRI
jgi:hypothetical protein